MLFGIGGIFCVCVCVLGLLCILSIYVRREGCDGECWHGRNRLLSLSSLPSLGRVLLSVGLRWRALAYDAVGIIVLSLLSCCLRRPWSRRRPRASDRVPDVGHYFSVLVFLGGCGKKIALLALRWRGGGCA